MIVTYETAPLKPLEPGGNVANQWRLAINRSIPAFLINSAGATLEEATAEYIEPYVEELNLVVSTFPLILGTRRRGDVSLHADGVDSRLTVLHAHHTDEGEDEASIFEHQQGGIMPSPRLFRGRPTNDRELFNLGFVEDQVLKPTRYFATLSPGSFLVFRRSLSHAFKSTRHPRSSSALIVSQKVDAAQAS